MLIKQGTFTLRTFGSFAPTTVNRIIVKQSLKNIWDKQQRIEIQAVMKVPCDHIQKEMEKKGLQLTEFAG